MRKQFWKFESSRHCAPPSSSLRRFFAVGQAEGRLGWPHTDAYWTSVQHIPHMTVGRYPFPTPFATDSCTLFTLDSLQRLFHDAQFVAEFVSDAHSGQRALRYYYSSGILKLLEIK